MARVVNANIDRCLASMLALALDRPWRQISLRDIAAHAAAPLDELYAEAPGKTQLLALLSRRYDREVLGASDTFSEETHDRLFDAVMARVEAMEADRAALTAIAREVPASALLPHFSRTARAILEAAGLEATPPRIGAMVAVWARVVHVWRDDEGALNRTMAEIDRRLRQLRDALGRVGAGF